MNNQQITQRLLDDTWIYEIWPKKLKKNGYIFQFHDFEVHEIYRDDKFMKTVFEGQIRTETHYKAIMSMLNIK